MTADPGSDPLPDHDPKLRALASIDAVHAADPGPLNEQVRRLRRFVRIRRPLYYSVLGPFGALSRVSSVLVLASGVVAGIGVIIAIFVGAPAAVTGLLIYWSLGASLYHALSVRLAILMGEAAASVGLSPSDLLAEWKG